jgi:hypothetical protein
MKKFHLRFRKNKFLMIILVLLLFFLPNFLQINFSSLSGINSDLFSYLLNPEKVKIDTVNTLNPVLSWYKIKGATKYQLRIKEYENFPDEKSVSIIRTFEVTDTFFVVLDLVLQDGKIYSWNVRSFNGKMWGNFGDEFFFKVNLKFKPFELKPVTVSPGKFSPEIEIVKTLNPVFKWERYKGSIGYELIIFEESGKGKTRKIFSEENLGLVKDTFFVLKGNLLKPDTKYGWQVRSKLPSKFSPLSEIRYFKIVLSKKLVSPQPIYPGYKIENKEIVATTTPTFVWKKIPDAESYALAISKKDLNGKYRLIYDTERLIELKDTIFTLPDGVLENNSFYRWNIKVNLKDGRSIYSGRLYFKVNLSETPKFQPSEIEIKKTEAEEIEEILLNLEYAGIVKSFIQAVSYKNEIFISLEELLDNIQIPYVKNDKLTESKSNDISNYFAIDFIRNKAQNKFGEFELNQNDFINYYNQKYFSLNFIERLLSIDLEFDFASLVLYVKSERSLPVYNEYLLEQRLSSLKQIQHEKSLPLLFDRKRSFLNGFVFDYNISQTLMRNQKSNYSVTTAIGGEIFYGDFYYSRQLFKTPTSKSIIENYNWKFTPDPNKLLTQLTLGDNFIDGINSYTFRGIGVTNEPIEPRKRLGTYLYKDITEPNSYVELYLNNELIDLTKSDERGFFTFEFPIGYGMSNYEFRVHTLKGETKSYRKLYQIPYDLLPEGTFNYQLNFGKLRFTENKLANLELKYGVKNYLTLNAGSEWISDSTHRYLNFFGKSSFRIASNLLLNVFFSPKIQTKLAASYVRPDYASAYFEFVKYKQHNFYNPGKFKNSLKSSFYYPLKFRITELGLYFNYEILDAEMFRRDFWSLNYYLLHNWFSLTGGLNFENNRTSILLKRRDLMFGTTINFNNIFPGVSLLNKSFLSAKTNFDLLKNKIFSYSIYYTTSIIRNLRFQINYENIVQIRTSNINMNLYLELPQFKYLSNSNGRDLYNHQLTGSIGFSPEINNFYLYSEPQIGRSTLYIEGFEDKNGNGLRDKGEASIEGLDYVINSAAYSTNLNNGAKVFYGLNPYQEYDLRINEVNLKSLNYSYEFSEFKLMTDGNRLKVIQLPYFETGEIGGLVVRYFEKEEIPVPNIKLTVRNKKSGKEYLISTFSDGSFYFYGLPKGEYEIEIDKNILERLSLKSSPEKIEFEINPQKNLLIVENLKFVLK